MPANNYLNIILFSVSSGEAAEFFIAGPGKAFLDAVYLLSFGRYSFDWSSIDKNKLDLNILKKEIKKFPLRTKRLLEKYEYLP